MAADARLGTGFAYPLQLQASTGGIQTAVGVDSVRASLSRLFETAPGEQLFVPEYGSQLKYLVFEGDTDVLRAMCEIAVVDAIQQWEPRVASIQSMVITTDATRNGVLTLSLVLVLVDGQVVPGVTLTVSS